MRAKEETCPHPSDKQRTTQQGFTECSRCLADTSSPYRSRSYQLSPRVVLHQGDLVSIRNDGRARDRGRFMYAESNERTGLVSIAVLTHENTSKGEPISSGWRFVRPDRVRRG
jgi:hypothetical protein